MFEYTFLIIKVHSYLQIMIKYIKSRRAPLIAFCYERRRPLTPPEGPRRALKSLTVWPTSLSIYLRASLSFYLRTSLSFCLSIYIFTYLSHPSKPSSQNQTWTHLSVKNSHTRQCEPLKKTHSHEENNARKKKGFELQKKKNCNAFKSYWMK